MIKAGLLTSTLTGSSVFDKQQADKRAEEERIRLDQERVKQGNCPAGFTQTGPNMTCVRAGGDPRQAEFDRINAEAAKNFKPITATFLPEQKPPSNSNMFGSLSVNPSATKTGYMDTGEVGATTNSAYQSVEKAVDKVAPSPQPYQNAANKVSGGIQQAVQKMPEPAPVNKIGEIFSGNVAEIGKGVEAPKSYQTMPSPQALVDKAQAEAMEAKKKAEEFAKQQAEKAKENARGVDEPRGYQNAGVKAGETVKTGYQQAEKAVDKVAPMVKDAVPAGLKQEGGFLKSAEATVEKIGKGLMDEVKPISKTGMDLAKDGAVKVGDVSKMAKEEVPEVKKIVDSFGKPQTPENEKKKMEDMAKLGVAPPKDVKDMEDLRKGIYRPEGKEVPGTGLLESLQKDLAALQSMLGKLVGGKGSGYTSGELFGSTNSLILIALVVAIIIASRR